MSVTVQGAVECGDVVSVSARRVGEHPRIGEIVEVLGSSGHPHYAVRWEDGHQSILYPGEGVSIRRHGLGRPSTSGPAVAQATRILTDALREEGVSFEVLPHRRTTNAASEARALGLLPQAVAKTVVAVDPEGTRIRAVVPASEHVGVAKLAQAVAAPRVTLLAEDELAAAYPQFELGAVPPLGGPTGDRVVIDRTLSLYEHVVFEGGTHDTSLRMRTDDLVTAARAQVADIAVS